MSLPTAMRRIKLSDPEKRPLLLTHDNVTASRRAACCAKVELVHAPPCITLALINPIKSTNATRGETLQKYQLWDSNPHSVELDFESSASTNSAKLATESCGRIKQEKNASVKRKCYKSCQGVPAREP